MPQSEPPPTVRVEKPKVDLEALPGEAAGREGFAEVHVRGVAADAPADGGGRLVPPPGGGGGQAAQYRGSRLRMRGNVWT